MIFGHPLLLVAIVLLMAQGKYAQSLSQGVEEFSLDLLNRIAVDSNQNFMISPFSVWSLFVLLDEGADGETHAEMHKALRINVDHGQLREFYRERNKLLNVKTSGVEVGSLQAVYISNTFSVKRTYRNVLQNIYNVSPMEVDFHDLGTVRRINEDITRSTRGLIKDPVKQKDVTDAKLFLLSSLYFKGQWKTPFQSERTFEKPFYNENGQVIAQVPMMSQDGTFATADIKELGGSVLKMPYGSLEWVSMIVVKPNDGVTLNAVTNNLKTLGLQAILEKLTDQEVIVFLPKFETTTDLSLKETLVQMGMPQLFDERKANLDRIARGLYVSLCKQSTKIIVDEEGTTAAAVTAITVGGRSLFPTTFRVDKPFLYLIVEKETGLLLFAGQVRNPKAA
ncbi:serine protease inhibitor 77Ba-like [Drosophila takahashii]|uniref:serine protease inhibitor 77Ba-like n=1 Tax=Drosophila takahashii TaxID=29030 RepID=UPI001CF8607E|nr:serine protease inhibitor 77Ba-like [Drosophila takahashii]